MVRSLLTKSGLAETQQVSVKLQLSAASREGPEPKTWPMYYLTDPTDHTSVSNTVLLNSFTMQNIESSPERHLFFNSWSAAALLLWLQSHGEKTVTPGCESV